MATGSGGARHPGAPYYEHAAVAAAAEAASAGTTPPSATSKRCTPLGADGRPVGLPDDVQQQQKDYGMALGSVGGAGGGRGKRPGKKRKTADQGGREGAQEDYYPHPLPQYSCTRSPAAMSFYSYSPTTRAPQRFMFDDADAVGVARADAGRHRYQPYYHRFHGPMPPYGSPAVPPTTTLPPVPVTMGGSVTPGGAAAVALMAAPLGSPLHLQGQPITPAAVSTAAAAAAAAAAARVPTTTTSFPSMSSNASAKVSPREIATTNSAKISPSPTATTSHAPIKAPMGLGASAPLLTPTAVTSDHYQGRDMEALQLMEPPTFESILNFPQGALRKKRGPRKGGGKTKTNDMRICIMCGLSCPTSSNKKKRDGNDTAVVPAQNRGVCTKCDVLVWVQISTGCQIKWCKGCKNFRHWAHFGPKGWTTKCTKCREHQNAKYAEKRGTQLDGRVKNNRRGKRIDSRVAEQEAARELLSLHSPRTYEALDQLGLDINEDVPPFPPSIGDEALV